MILIIGGVFQGKTAFAREKLLIPKEKIFDDFHIKMKRCISEKKSCSEIIKEIHNGNFEAVISNEIGCGIVPLDKEERLWREETGRALCEIARECTQVWRVFCGVGTEIKKGGFYV